MVFPLIAPALVGAGASILGGLFSSNAQKEANMMNAQMNAMALQQQQRENALNREQNLAINQQNIDLQREFAQHGVQWRVQDAQAAGLHPLAALGGTGASFSPVAHVSGGSPLPSPTPAIAETGMGQGLMNMGQDLSRAMHATMTSSTRNDAYTAASQAIDLQKSGLQIELLKSQLARLRQNDNPPMSSNDRYLTPGQGDTGAAGPNVKIKPHEYHSDDPRVPGSEPYALPERGLARDVAGNYAVVPSEKMKERIEDDAIMQTIWNFKNHLGPLVSSNYFKPPPVSPDMGKQWSYMPGIGYTQVPTPFNERFHSGRRW